MIDLPPPVLVRVAGETGVRVAHAAQSRIPMGKSKAALTRQELQGAGALRLVLAAEASDARSRGQNAAPGSGASAIGVGAGPPPSGPGFYVSPKGDDDNAGTRDAPFATLERARRAMEHSSIKAAYIEAGTYHLSETLSLTGADSGETWQYYPPDGVNSAVLDGGGRADLIGITGSHITINGLKMQHVASFAVFTPDRGARTPETTDLVLENCDIGFNRHTGTIGGFNPMIFIENSTHATIRNNYVHDTVSGGIDLLAYYPGHSINGALISGNVVVRAVLQVSDGGAIYVSMHGGSQNDYVTIANNYVRDYGGPGLFTAAGIYLDDNASHVTVTGNVIAPHNPHGIPTAPHAGFSGMAISIHNGHDNLISGNIIDLGSSGHVFVAVWYRDRYSIAGMAGNSFIGNIVVSSHTGPQANFGGFATSSSFWQNSPASDYAIRNNVYYNYAGGQVSTTGTVVGDSHPVLRNPELSKGSYAIAPTSPAFGGPVNFPSIIGGWGPLGFSIPGSGAAPSER